MNDLNPPPNYDEQFWEAMATMDREAMGIPDDVVESDESYEAIEALLATRKGVA